MGSGSACRVPQQRGRCQPSSRPVPLLPRQRHSISHPVTHRGTASDVVPGGRQGDSGCGGGRGGHGGCGLHFEAGRMGLRGRDGLLSSGPPLPRPWSKPVFCLPSPVQGSGWGRGAERGRATPPSLLRWPLLAAAGASASPQLPGFIREQVAAVGMRVHACVRICVHSRYSRPRKVAQTARKPRPARGEYPSHPWRRGVMGKLRPRAQISLDPCAGGSNLLAS